MIDLNIGQESLPNLPDAEIVKIPGQGVTLGGYLFVNPEIRNTAPAVVLLHGHGVDASDMVEPARMLGGHGFITLALSMRGWRGSGGEDDCGQHQADDTVCAVEWLAENPKVDGGRIGIAGPSQGGQVALLTAAKTSLIKAAAAHKPVTDIDRWEATTANPYIPEYISMVCMPNSRLRSPVDYAESINAPVLLIHGDADTRVQTEQSLLMQAALTKFGKTVELKLIKRATHRFGLEGVKRAWRWTLEFFDMYLKSLVV